MKDAIYGAIIVIAVLIFLISGFSWGRISIATDCDKLGKFSDSGKVYECKEIK